AARSLSGSTCFRGGPTVKGPDLERQEGRISGRNDVNDPGAPARVVVGDTEAAPRVVLSDPEDELPPLLEEMQRAVASHPAAARALFRAFVAEGRRFAMTPEGQRIRAELAGSSLIRRGHMVWDTCTMALGEGDPATPSELFDALVLTARIEALEPMLS